MNRFYGLVMAAVFIATLSVSAQEPGTRPGFAYRRTAHTEPSTRPAFIYREEVRTDPPLHLHIVAVDLTNPAVHLKVAHGGTDPDLRPPWETTLMPVSEMAQRDGMSVAINGNFFSSKDYEQILGRKVFFYEGNWARAVGWAMSDGKLFSRTPLSPDWPTLIINKTGNVAISQFNAIPPTVRQAVTGQLQIVTDGQNSVIPQQQRGELAPRTAVGFDRSQKTLYMLVVDGRRPGYSTGVTIHQLGDEMLSLGAYEAINLDSGGSSTMVLRDETGSVNVVNRPSDGHDLMIPLSIERSVACALGVVVDHPADATKSAAGN